MNLVSNSPGAKSRIRKDFLMQRDRGIDSLHHELREGTFHLGNGLVAIDTVDDELGDERIVIGRDDAFRVLSRIDANAIASGHVERSDLPCGRRELYRMFSVDAAFD